MTRALVTPPRAHAEKAPLSQCGVKALTSQRGPASAPPPIRRLSGLSAVARPGGQAHSSGAPLSLQTGSLDGQQVNSLPALRPSTRIDFSEQGSEDTARTAFGGRGVRQVHPDTPRRPRRQQQHELEREDPLRTLGTRTGVGRAPWLTPVTCCCVPFDPAGLLPGRGDPASRPQT